MARPAPHTPPHRYDWAHFARQLRATGALDGPAREQMAQQFHTRLVSAAMDLTPPAWAALNAALAHHIPYRDGARITCLTCDHGDDNEADYPCDEVIAVAEALRVVPPQRPTMIVPLQQGAR